jgi:hypothetical protein
MLLLFSLNKEASSWPAMAAGAGVIFAPSVVTTASSAAGTATPSSTHC